MMRETKIIILLPTLFFIFFYACVNNQGKIDENVQRIIIDFVEEKDFAGYIMFEDGLDTIKTCLSATLYDIDTNHYMTLIISRYPDDAFIGSPQYQHSPKPPMYYKVGNKDLFVFSHTIDSTYSPFPQSMCSEKMVLEKEKAYNFDEKVIDDRFAIQTYKYRICEEKVWIEKDSTFNFFQWLYPNKELASMTLK